MIAEAVVPNAPSSIGGLSLSEYAGVRAGLGAGAALDAVLECENVPRERWDRASPAWDGWLAEHAAAHPLVLEALEGFRAAAANRYQPALAPFDTSLDAWLALLRALSAAAEPTSLLSDVGLRPAELGALHRSWSQRANEDRALGSRLRAQLLSAAAPSEPPTSARLPSLERGPIRTSPPTAVERPPKAGPDLAPETVLGVAAVVVELPGEQQLGADAPPPLFVPLPRPPPVASPPTAQRLAPRGGVTPGIAETADLDLSAILAAVKQPELPFERTSTDAEPPASVAPTPLDLPYGSAGETAELSPELVAAMRRLTAPPFSDKPPQAAAGARPVEPEASAVQSLTAALLQRPVASSVKETGELTMAELQVALSRSPVPFAKRAKARPHNPLGETAEVKLSDLQGVIAKDPTPFAGHVASAPSASTAGSSDHRPASAAGETHEFSANELAAMLAERAVPFGGVERPFQAAPIALRQAVAIFVELGIRPRDEAAILAPHGISHATKEALAVEIGEARSADPSFAAAWEQCVAAYLQGRGGG